MFKTNPILFKDLLISLNGKIGRSIIIAFSVIYFIGFLLILSEMKYNYGFSDLSRYGNEIFMIAGISQLIILIAIGYLKGLVAISSEREQKTFSFIKISPIKNIQFIGGKFGAIFLYIILLFIISLPFLSIGLILGGVNIFDVLIYILYSISYISFSIMFGLLISMLSKKFSVILGLGTVPIFAVLLFLLFVLIPFDSISLNFSSNQEYLANAIFPIQLFSNLSGTELYITLFGIKIHYIIYHILLFLSVIGLIFKILINKYKSNYELNIPHYSYIETAILFIIIILLSPLFGENIFYAIFLFFILNYTFFLFNDKLLEKGKILKVLYFFIIIFLIGAIFLIIANGFIINTIFLYLSISISLLAIYLFFIKYLNNISKGLINLYYTLFLILFFYVIPLLSSNLLEIKYSNINNILITSYHNDGLLNYNCNLKKENTINLVDNSFYINNKKCSIIKNTNLYYYILFYLIFSGIIIGIGSLIEKKRNKNYK